MSIPLPYPNINDTDANDVQTWSSAKILDYLKPALDTEVTKTAEATGAEVTFVNIDPDTCVITKAGIEILPSQQGSGDPSPDNPRTINSFDTVYITQHNADNTESTTYEISLGATVYGVTGDGVTGEFENKFSMSDLKSESWTHWNNTFYCSVSDKKNNTDIMCNILKFAGNFASASAAASGLNNYEIGGYSNTESANKYIYIKNTDCENVTQLIEFLDNAQVLYEISTPSELTATPITSDLYEGTNVLGVAPSGTVDIEITCTDKIGNILKKEGIL